MILFPFELFVGFYCTEETSLIFTSIIILIWASESRWIWAKEESTGQSKWINELGRQAFLTLTLLLEGDHLASVLHLDPQSFLFIVSMLGLMSNQENRDSAADIVSIIFTLFRSPLIYLGGAQKSVWILYVMELWILCNRSRCAIYQPEAPLLPSQTVSEQKASDSSLINMAEQTRLASTEKGSEDGALLVQAMAPQILLHLLTDSDEYVSVLIENAGNIRWISNSVEKLYGYSKSELLGTNGWSIVHPDDIPRLTKTSRDSTDRIRTSFRRRRKDGTYLLIDSYGMYSEGFLFFQEHVRREYPTVPIKHDGRIDLSSLATAACELIGGASDLGLSFYESLRDCRNDIIGTSNDPTANTSSFSLKEILDAVIRESAKVKTKINETARSKKILRVDLEGLERSKDILVTCDKRRLVAVFERLVNHILAIPENNELNIMISSSPDIQTKVIFRMTYAKEDASDSMEWLQARSFFTNRFGGEFNLVSEQRSTAIEASITFNQNQPTPVANPDICLVVDDDAMILRVMERKLPAIWRERRGRDLTVLTARSSQAALELLRSQVKSGKLVIVDLDLGENSQMTGYELAKYFKDREIFQKIVILTSTEDFKCEFSVVAKNAPNLFTELCE